MPTWVMKYLPELLAVLALIGALAVAHHAGVASTREKYELQIAKRNTETAAAIASAEAGKRKAEADAAATVAAQATKFHEGERDAQKQIDLLRAAVRAGSIRLSVPIIVSSPAFEAGADPGVTGGTIAETRAELSSAAADALIGIAADGDSAIRQLDAVLDAYEGLREQMNVQRCGQ